MSYHEDVPITTVSERNPPIFLLITLLFNGGVVASYMINTTMFHLKNNLLTLILPGFARHRFFQGNFTAHADPNGKKSGLFEGTYGLPVARRTG